MRQTVVAEAGFSVAKSGERQYKYDVPEYLKALLKLAWRTQETMFDAIEARREESSPPDEEEFRRLLQRLWFRYKPKLKHTSKVSLDDEIQNKIEQRGILELPFEDCVTVCTEIRDLMEVLGHTKFETETWEETKIGGKD